MSERSLVWLAEVPFAGPPHRQQHLARLLGSKYRVLYVEPPRPLTAPRLKLTACDGLLVGQAAPLANAKPLRKLMARPMGLRLAAAAALLQLRRLMHVAGMSPAQKATVVCSNVFLFEAALRLRPRILVTDMCDDPRHYPGEPPWTAMLLRRAVHAADLVTTSSLALQQDFQQLGARHLALVPNGIHQQFLAQATAQIPTPRPLVGFVGHLGPWVDFQLLARVADELPWCTVELVGSVAPDCRSEFDVLRARPNVRYTPAVPYSDVPRVLARFSVGLIPFRVTPYTRAVNPIKLYEYAAFNLPVISSAFSPDVASFQTEIDVCSDPDEFVRLAGERAAGRGRRPTRQVAEAHTWEHISNTFTDLIHSVRTCPRT